MLLSDANITAPAIGRGPAAVLAVWSAGLAAGVYIASGILAGAPMLLPMLGFGIGAGVTCFCVLLYWPASRLGFANALTLGRLALAMLLLVPLSRPDLASGGTGWAIFALALATLSLDGLDGPLARRSGLVGPWGARFDMEVDAIFALLLAAVAWRSGTAGPWILLLGGMRYLFVLGAFAFPWLGGPLPARLRRKAVCVVQIGVLTGLLAPVAEPPWTVLAALVALGLLTWSFATDVIWLALRR